MSTFGSPEPSKADIHKSNEKQSRACCNWEIAITLYVKRGVDDAVTKRTMSSYDVINVDS